MAKLRSCIRMLAPYRLLQKPLVFCPDRCMLFSVLASLCIAHTPVMHQKALDLLTKSSPPLS